MDFYQKVKELELIHSRIETERKNLEVRMKQKTDYQQSFYEIKAKEIQQELAHIDTQRIKQQARNQRLQKNIEDVLHQYQENDTIQRARLTLESAKKDFINDLNRSDPLWMDKIRSRKQEEINNIALERQRLQREISIKQQKLQEDQIQNENLQKIQSDYHQDQLKLAQIEQKRQQVLQDNQTLMQQNQARDIQILQQQNEIQQQAELLNESLNNRSIEGKSNLSKSLKGTSKSVQQEVERAESKISKKSKDSSSHDNTQQFQEQSFSTKQAPKPTKTANTNQIVEPSVQSKPQHVKKQQSIMSDEQIDSDFDQLLNEKSAKGSSGALQHHTSKNIDAKQNSQVEQYSDDQDEKINNNHGIQNVNQKQVQNQEQSNQNQNNAFQPDWDEDEYYDEEENEEEDLKIVLVGNRIDKTFEDLSDTKKLALAGIVYEYVDNLLNQKTINQGGAVFEKSREVKVDRDMKYNLIELYNSVPEEFSSQDYSSTFDLGIACDILLDLLRYEDSTILNPDVVMQDHMSAKKQKRAYKLDQLYEKVKNSTLREILKCIFKLIIKARSLKSFQNLSSVCNNVAEAIIDETSIVTKNELSQVLKGCINDAMEMTLQSSSSQEIAKLTGHTNRSASQQSPSRQSGANSKMKIDLEDDIRIDVAQQLRESIEAEIKIGNAKNSNLYNQSTYQLLEDQSLLKLIQQIQEEDEVPENLDLTQMGALLLAMMLTRTQQNIDKTALQYLEESGDFSQFNGFFHNKNAKQIFDILVKHFVVCIKKKIVKQSEAENLILNTLINFQCTNDEQQMLKHCVVDALTHAISFDSDRTNQNSAFGSASNANNSMNANTNEFQLQQQQYLMSKSRFSQMNKNQQQNQKKQPVEEFEQEEINDDY